MPENPTVQPLADNAVVLVLSADDHYVPYAGVLLKSLADAASEERLYDVLVMHTNIAPEHQAQLEEMAAKPNISLRFIDVTPEAARCANLFTRGHFRIETYYRLLLPELLPEYAKVLYLDCDMLICRDIAELYDTDLEGNLLGAVLDADTAGAYNGYRKNYKHYLDDVLRLRDPYDYFQAGTILFDLDQFRAAYSVDEMLQLAASYDWILLDQDVLNRLAEGRAKVLPWEWNVVTDWRGVRIRDIISLAPASMREAYLASRKDPAIIHYAGPDKPWDHPASDMAERFWAVAAETPFMAELLDRKAAHDAQAASPAFRAKQFLVYRVASPVVAALFPRGTKRRDFLEKMRGCG